ncbi:MAG: hypothetical protein MZV64_28500 [Ignavibacteriales bacterium]|nr:hypothetical protein [Ignavibacteriales bacterium]
MHDWSRSLPRECPAPGAGGRTRLSALQHSATSFVSIVPHDLTFHTSPPGERLFIPARAGKIAMLHRAEDTLRSIEQWRNQSFCAWTTITRCSGPSSGICATISAPTIGFSRPGQGARRWRRRGSSSSGGRRCRSSWSTSGCPEMTGTELLAEVKELHPEARKVLLTAYADTDVAIESINRIGLDHYLMKPWDPPEEKLYPVLDDLLSEWKNRVHLPFDGIRIAGARFSPQSHAVQ